MTSRGSHELTRRGLLGGAALAGLAGCGLSVDRTVRPGLDVAAPDVDSVTVVPAGPVDGASPEEVILGFMRAGAATGGQLSVARSFLVPATARAWLPDSQTVVHDADGARVEKVGEGLYRVKVGVTARIDSENRYTVAPPFDGATFDFGLRLVDGQWRIGSLQEGFGRVLSTALVRRMYRPYRVHYTAIGWNRLVPDLRWIPQDQQTTRLTRAQCGRLPDYLEGAVQTDAGAELAVDAVPLVDGAAQVDLRADSLSRDATVRQNFAAQLVATLMPLEPVTEVVLTADGMTLDLPDVEPPLTTPAQLGFSEEPVEAGDTTIVVRDGQRVVPLTHSEVLSLSSRSLAAQETPFATMPREWGRIALSVDGKEVAAVHQDGGEMGRWNSEGELLSVPFFGDRLSQPTYDSRGVLWVGGRGLGADRGQRLWAINTAADSADLAATTPQPVPAPWLEGREVRAVSVSAGGSRVAVISSAKNGADVKLTVAGVVRRPNGLPTGTSPEALQVAARLVDLVDMVWIAPTRLAVIGRQDKEPQLRPYVVEVGGEIEELAPVSRPAGITTLGGWRQLVVVTEKGRVMLRTGARWAPIATISDLEVAGR